MAAAGAVLLTVLKVCGILLGAAAGLCLLVLLLAAALPATVRVRYEKEAFWVQAGLGGLRVPVVKNSRPAPWLQWLLRRLEKRPAGRKKKKTPPPAAPRPARPRHLPALGLTLDEICTLAGGAGRFFRAVLGAVRVTKIRLYLPVHEPDAAATALTYGQAQAWLHGCLGVLNNLIWLEFAECRLDPDFTGDQAGKAYFSCNVSARLIIIGIAAWHFIQLLLDKDILDKLI